MNPPEPLTRPSPFPRIIYWKWDPETLERGLYREKAIELCRRSLFDHVYVSLVWSGHELTEPLCRDSIADAAALLRQHGRRLVFDLDPRIARREFARRHPESLLELLTTEMVTLDADGGAAVRHREGPSGDHYGEYPVLASRHVATWVFDVDAAGRFLPASLTAVDPRVTVNGPGSVDVVLALGAAQAGRRAFVAIAHTYEYPDPFAPALRAFHEELFEYYRGAGLGGVCLDEWGFPPHPGFSFSRAWRHPWYGTHLAAEYEARTGRAFLRDVLHMQIAPATEPALQTRAIHDHADFVRTRHIAMEDAFYQKAKEVFGPDCFVGVHPTWYAIHRTECAPEIWKNGFDWFGVRRDFAQTDEICPYPVRLALAHKWGGRPFYNMYYSMETRDIRTYIREIWETARYGGRTHVLSYECEREKAGMLQLREGEGLETVSRAMERIALLDQVQASMPRSDVLVVMGYGAAVDWRANAVQDGHWDLSRGPFVEAFAIAQSIWEHGFLCDLVASYEIGAGALSVSADGRAGYGGNVYDYVVYVRPDYAEERELAFLERLDPDRLRIVGGAREDRNGNAVAERFAAIRARCLHSDHTPLPILLDRDLRAKGVAPNDIDCGSRLADGMVIITSHTTKPEGAPLDVRVEINGHTVTAEARDLFAVKLGKAGVIEKLAAGDLKWVAVDGKVVIEEEQPGDMVLA